MAAVAVAILVRENHRNGVSADAGRRRWRSAQPDPPAYSKVVEVVTASDPPGMRPPATSSASRASSGSARWDLFEGAFVDDVICCIVLSLFVVVCGAAAGQSAGLRT